MDLYINVLQEITNTKHGAYTHTYLRFWKGKKELTKINETTTK